MSLSLRLTLSLLLLLALLAGLALFGLNALTSTMRTALGETVTEVGHSLITVLREERIASDGPRVKWIEHSVKGRDAPAATDSTTTVQHDEQVRVIVNGRELSAEEIAALPAEQRPGLLPQLPGDGRDVRFELHRDASGERPALRVHGLGMDDALIPIPQSRADAALAGFRQQLGWGLLALFLLGAVLASLLARRIAAPLQALAAGAARVGRGDLNQQIHPSGPPEVRQSIDAFNRMARDLQRLQNEAEALRADRELAELGEIGRGLAHSLRNPLHALGLSLDALGEDASNNDRGRALLQQGREQLARIDQALRGFLALSASAGASVELVELDEVIDDVVLEASQRAQGRVRFARQRRGLRLSAVAAELRIMIHALVVNALEASPDGSEIAIDVDAAEAPMQGVQIRIDDDGPGLPAAVRQRLFQPHTSSKPAGAGMGLYLAERLARLRYHGSIELQDKSPSGTRALLSLGPREGDSA